MKLANRRNTYSLKWDIKENELPMWVADMDFESPECVKEAIISRASIGAYGYSIIPDSYFNAYHDFWLKHYDVDFNTSDMIYTTGVVPSISSIVRSVADEGDNVVILSPVYNIFYNSIRNSKRVILPEELVFDGKEYDVDYKSLEEKLSLPKTKLLIFCNPHNPVGKIWSESELKKIYDLCIKHKVVILSDEIHSPITTNGIKYIPFAKIGSKNLITCISVSKCFNLAGLQAALAISSDKELKYIIEKGLNRDEVAENNFFSVEAHVAALIKGEDYLKELNDIIYENKQYAYKFFSDNIKLANVVKSDATYLLWVDVRKITLDTEKLCEFIRNDSGLIISCGDSYGKSGCGFLRINLATSLDNVKDGLNRLKKSLEAYNG